MDVSLVQIAAFLIARNVYDRRNTVDLSDVWFECMTGRSHGPMWFRRTQVALKAVLLVSSICVGLSINAIEDEWFHPMPVQRLLIRQERTMAQLGIGNPPSVGEYQNFSSDVMFMLAASRCTTTSRNASSGATTHVHWNAVPREQKDVVQNQDGLPPIKCLFAGPIDGVPSTPAVLRTKVLWDSINRKGLLQCDPQLPHLHEIKSGLFSIMISKSPWRLTHFSCQAKYRGSCALTLELEEYQVLETADYDSKEIPPVAEFSNLKSWRKRDSTMVQMAAQYVDSGLQASPDQLDFLSSFQSGKGSIFEYKCRKLPDYRFARTEIDLIVFLPGFVTILVIVSGFIVTAVVSRAAMMRNNGSEYALGLRVADVVRFARIDDGDSQGKSLFLKLHCDFPHLTVSGDGENCGNWSVDEVLGPEVVK